MTKHLEERLSEAFDAAARTVPDNAVPPELFRAEPRTERRWVPMLAIGLAVAAVVTAVAVPIAISRINSAPAPASTPCPTPPAAEALTYSKQESSDSDYADLNKLPFGPPPKVPFAMARDAELTGGYLEDSGVRVPLKAGEQVYSLGRVDCGWVVIKQPVKGGDLTVGVLRTDATFRSIGVTTGDGWAMSPDGSQFAYVAPAGKGKAEVVTISVATGKRLAATPAGTNSQVGGWNTHGVWFMPDRDKYVTKLWKPGATPITVNTDGRRLTAYRGTDRMLLSDQAVPNNNGSAPGLCVRVATLDTTNKLKTVRQVCGGTGGALSPDGRVLVAETTNGVQAYQVDSGAKTAFHTSTLTVTADHESIWEDSTHLLDASGLGTDRQVTLRCDVLSGSCERIQDGRQQNGPVGPELGYP